MTEPSMCGGDAALSQITLTNIVAFGLYSKHNKYLYNGQDVPVPEKCCDDVTLVCPVYSSQ